MIFVTGDCHGDFCRFSHALFPEGRHMTKDDYVIICGDFGYWLKSNRMNEVLDKMDNKPWTTLFVDGNHENFDGLYQEPVELWHGGKIHRVRDSVIHLCRGQYFTDIDGRSIFAFGGASSYDVQGGIFHVKNLDEVLSKEQLKPSDIREEELEDFLKAKMYGEPFRIEHVSWWKEEVPSEKEFETGMENLSKHNFKVDFIITHDGPQSDISLFSHGTIDPDTTRLYLEEFRARCDYKRWYFGHHHADVAINDKDILLYYDVIRIN